MCNVKSTLWKYSNSESREQVLMSQGARLLFSGVQWWMKKERDDEVRVPPGP